MLLTNILFSRIDPHLTRRVFDAASGIRQVREPLPLWSLRLRVACLGTDPMRDRYPKRAPNIASRVLRGKAILMNPVDSGLFDLNETATAIWQAADGRTTLREIVEQHVCPQFEVDPATALADAEELVQGLVPRILF